ncbi:MAG: putative lipid II flippase FtsW [Candidatus Omnitrophota bacterium]
MYDSYVSVAHPKDLRKERRFIFLLVLFLTLFGTLMVYESSSLYAYKTTSDPASFFKKQFIFFIAGLVLFFLTLLCDLDFLRAHAKEFLFATIFILLVLLIIGKKAGGARRWFTLGGFNFQPSELLKIFFLMYCVDYVIKRKMLIRKARTLIPLGIVMGLICVSVVLQPDLGTAMFWIVWTLLFLFMHHARGRHLLFVIALGAILSFFLITFYPYRFRRITGYLNPFADPRDAGFQLIQSQIAYGQGGLWGVGLGEGRQKLFFLPAAHTDFIFSIIAEEFGLLGSLGLVAVFLVLFHRMIDIAKNCRDDFRQSILLGVILIFFLEIAVNMGVSCGLFPTKGLPLPFVSYGGSNLIVHYVLLGLFFNASRSEEDLT